MLKSASWFTVAALIAGVIVGTMVGLWGSSDVRAATETFESIGVLWLNALRMTVIPLVFCLLVTGIASVADAAATGRLAVRAIVVFTVLLVVATAYACLLVPAVLTLWPVDPSAAAAFIAGATDKPVVPASPPTIGEWLAALAPSNPISAAAEGAVLPLTVFATFFGFAATRLPAGQREPMVNFFRAVADTMIIIVRWVLIAAPLGVFALSLGVGVRSGLGAAGVLLQYIVIACGVTFGIAVMAFLFAVIWGRIGVGRFLNASAPVLAVAFSTQSSLASLPIMVERATGPLGVPGSVANLVLPLAVAVFRMTSPVTNLVVVFFVAAVHGTHLDISTIISGGIVAIAISVGSVGLPGQVSFIASVGPICLAMGVPIDVLGILLAVEVIPDIFRTVGNVMGDMAATVISNRSGAAAKSEPKPAAEAA